MVFRPGKKLQIYGMELREPAVACSKQKMSIEEYLIFEDAAAEKHEYYQGEVFALSGAKKTHNEIVVNTFPALPNSLKAKTAGHITVISGFI